MRSSTRGAAWCPIALVSLATSRAVAAAPAGNVALEWSQEDPTCLASADLIATVERALARSVFRANEPAVAKVVGVVGRRGPGRFEARIVLRDRGGAILAERDLVTSSNCKRLDESVAVVVALMIDGMEEAPATLHVADQPPRPPPAPAPPAPPPPPPAPHEKPLRLGLTVGAGAGVSSWLWPGAVAWFAARSEVAVGSFVPIALTVRAPQTPFLATVGDAGGRFTVASGELAGCPAWSTAHVRIGGCAGVGISVISGGYFGNLSDGEGHVRPLILMTLLPFAAAHLAGPLWARVEGGAWVPLYRDAWGFNDYKGTPVQVYRPAPLVPAGALTLELQIGS
jgi:hypothetical protein